MKSKLLVLFIIISTCIAFPQEYKYAVLSEIRYGSPGSEEQLKSIVDNINSRTEIKFVVITGNTTRDGKDEQFTGAKKILDKLKVDYYPVSGFTDMKKNASGGSKDKELWEDDKFALDVAGNAKHIGMNDYSPWRTKGHFSIEDLLWLDTVITSAKPNEEFYFYSSCPLEEKNIGNWYEALNRFSDKNLRAVFYPASENKILLDSPIPKVLTKPSVTKELGWNYTLVDNSTDSISFFEIFRDTGMVYWGSLSKTIPTQIAKIDSTGFINYNADIVWQKDLQKKMYAPVLITQDKIFTASFEGEITCFDLTGNIIWEKHLERTVLSGFTRVNDLLLVGTYEGDLFSLNANNGTVVQVIGIGEPITSQLVTADVHYNDSDTKGVIAETAAGNVYFYEVNSFEQIWVSRQSTEMITTKPLALKEKILYTAKDGILYNIDINSGVLNWKWSAKNSYHLSSPFTDGKNVYISSADKSVTAIDLLRGRSAWRRNEHNADESIILSSDQQNLLIKSQSDYFIIADASTGKMEKKINCGFQTDPDPSDILQVNSNILFGAGSGIVYSINKNYRPSPLLFLGNARITTLQSADNNLIIAANCDGKIVIFKLKQD
jgi:outer membrane protein assembly factor BamB